MNHPQTMKRKQTSGFTIIEILVAILLLGVITAALFSTLSGSLNLNSQANNQVNKASQAQQVVEAVRGAWAIQANYDTACVPGLSTILTNTSSITANKVQFANLSTRAEPVTAENVPTKTVTNNPVKPVAAGASCSLSTTSTVAAGATVTPIGGTSMPPAMRRITVSTGTTALDTTLTLDVLRPQ